MIRIVADTLSCLSPETAKNLGIYYLPQIIIIDEETFRDDTEIDSNTFLKKLRASPTLPKTAAPPPALYSPIYQEATKRGDTLIVICPPSTLSGTYRSAEVAIKDFPDLDVRIIETHVIAGNLGAIVLETHKWIEQGFDADTIVQKINHLDLRQRTYFYVDTLEYLHKGGRIGGAQALFGSLLQVKPILQLINGRVEAFESQRTHKRALARLRDLVYSECPKSSDSLLSIMHCEAEALANNLAVEFSQYCSITEIPIYFFPPAILVHTGPGALAIGYFVSE